MERVRRKRDAKKSTEQEFVVPRDSLPPVLTDKQDAPHHIIIPIIIIITCVQYLPTLPVRDSASA